MRRWMSWRPHDAASPRAKGIEMRNRLVACAVACGIGLGGAIAATPPAVAGAAAGNAAPAAAASCVYGRIGGVRKCLRAGEYCARRYQHQYRRYGFTCSKLDYLGRWHLERA
jgi:hypothetical protein